jgi:hypothetical protein
MCIIKTTLFFFITLASDAQSTSIDLSIVEPGNTNKDTIAYCAVEFSSETNKIPIAAAEKMLIVYDKIIEAECAELASTYVLHDGGSMPVEKFIQLFKKERLIRNFQFWLKEVLTSYSYDSLSAIDGVLYSEILNAQYVSRIRYRTEYENMQKIMSDKQFSAFIVIHAYYRSRMNEIFMKALINSRFPEKEESGKNTNEVVGDRNNVQEVQGNKKAEESLIPERESRGK